jgi:hypothetical protein
MMNLRIKKLVNINENVNGVAQAKKGGRQSEHCQLFGHAFVVLTSTLHIVDTCLHTGCMSTMGIWCKCMRRLQRFCQKYTLLDQLTYFL